MRVIILSIYVFAIFLFTISCQAEKKLILSVEEIKSLSIYELEEIWDEMEVNNIGYESGYDSLADVRLISLGQNIDKRDAILKSAVETIDRYTEIDKRKRLDIGFIDSKWKLWGNLSTDIIDSIWRMEPVRIDTDENINRGAFKRKYLIYKSEELVDSIVVGFGPVVAHPGFVPKKTFVINGKPVISYRGEGHIGNDKLWIDGININEQYKLTEAIMPCYYNDKLFFVFKKGEKWGWCYDGEMHYDVWDRVSHHYGSQGAYIGEITKPNANTGFTARRFDDGQFICKVVIKEILE